MVDKKSLLKKSLFCTLFFLLSLNVISQETQKILGDETVWRYHDDNFYPGNQWYQPSFDDSNWKAGIPYFATPEETRVDGLKTILKGGSPAYPSYYFRTKFNIENLKDITSIYFTIDYDDAYLVYINGVKVGSSNLSCNWESHKTFCIPYPHNSILDFGKQTNPVSPKTVLNDDALKNFKNGENQIAVIIKQGSRTSTDAAFQLLMNAEKQPAKLDQTQIGDNSNTENKVQNNTKKSRLWVYLLVPLTIILILILVLSYPRGDASPEKADIPNADMKKLSNPKESFTYLLLEESSKPNYSHLLLEIFKGKSCLIISREKNTQVKEQLLDYAKNKLKWDKFYINLDEDECIIEKDGETKIQGLKILWMTDAHVTNDHIIESLPTKIAIEINQFVKDNRNSVVFVDGLSFLINKYEFHIILKLLSDIKDNVSAEDSILIISEVKSSLSEKQIGMLKSEVEIVQ